MPHILNAWLLKLHFKPYVIFMYIVHIPDAHKDNQVTLHLY